MAQPANMPIGDETATTEIPRTNTPNRDLAAEKKMAAFMQTDDYKTLKSHFEARIKFYQGNLPGGASIRAVKVSHEDWVIADAIISELSAVLDVYQTAKETLAEATAEETAATTDTSKDK